MSDGQREAWAQTSYSALRQVTRRLLLALTAALAVSVPAAAAAAAPVKMSVGPAAVQVVAAGSVAYVASAPLKAKPGHLVFVDLRRDRVFARVTVGHNPEAIAVDQTSGRAYVANYDDPGSISVIDVRLRKVVRTLPAGANPGNLAVVGPRGHRLLVVLNQGQTSPTRGSVDVWNLRTMKRLGRLRTKFTPIGLASLGAERMLVGDANKGYAYVLDPNRMRLVRRVTIPAGPVNDIAVGPTLVYVTADPEGITVLSRLTLTPVGSVVPSLPPSDPVRVAVSATDIGYVVDNGFGAPHPGTLQVLDGAGTAAFRPLGLNAIGIALTQDQRTLLVTAYDEGKLWVLPVPTVPAARALTTRTRTARR
jgi:YVTN family beta-propeller protein